jgi:hypothetical protein
MTLCLKAVNISSQIEQHEGLLADYCSAQEVQDGGYVYTWCYPDSSNADVSIATFNDLYSVTAGCFYSFLFDLTADDFKAKLTDMYNGLTDSCKVCTRCHDGCS